LREGDLRFPARRLCDLDRVIDNRANVRLREGVRCGESKRTVREDSDADARVVPDIERVKDSVLQDEILRFLSLEARLRISRPLRSRVVDRKTHKVHFPVQDRAPKDGPSNGRKGMKVSHDPRRAKPLWRPADSDRTHAEGRPSDCPVSRLFRPRPFADRGTTSREALGR